MEQEKPKSTADERIADYTWWLAAFTAALVGVAFIQFVISMIQIRFLIRADETASITANAAKLSADASMAAESAHVRILPQSHNYWDAAGKFAALYPNSPEMSRLSEQVVAQIVFKNYGKTLASLREASVRLQCSPEPPERLTGFIPMLSLPDERVLAANAVTDSFTSGLGPSLTMKEAIAISKGELSIWLIGHVVYADVFGRVWTQHFLYKLQQMNDSFIPYYEKTRVSA